MIEAETPLFASLPEEALRRLRAALYARARFAGAPTIALDTARGIWRHRLELLALTLVIATCVAVRVARLGTVPRIIAGDETDNLQNAYQIIKGTGPGIFGFDWKPSPILGLYPLAWTVQLFGNTVSDFRMYPVILSLLTIVLFYLLARQSMDAVAALAAALLLGTNLWFLHFSRTAWDNMNAALFAVGACWATTRALKTGARRWWAVTGLFVTASLYGYFSGRPVFISVALAAGIAVVLRLAPLRRTAIGLAIAGVIAGALFAPMAMKIANNWDFFNRRTNTISVFKIQDEYEGDSNHWVIALRNADRNFRGLILQDGSEMNRGLAARYNPVGRAPLDHFSAYLFWLGLVVSAIRWRKTYTWWPFFLPMFIVEVLSTGTPDLARGLVSAPFYFLFIGMLCQEVFQLAARPVVRGAAAMTIIVMASSLGALNVHDYFHWQNRDVVQTMRLPGLDHCEFNLFRKLAGEATANGGLMDAAKFDQQRRELNCSSLVSNWLPPPTPLLTATAQGTPISQATPVAAALAIRGVYSGTIAVADDPQGNAPFIGSMPTTISVHATRDSNTGTFVILFAGDAPFISVTSVGDYVEATGRFKATGSGTVTTRQIRVDASMDGALIRGHLSADVTFTGMPKGPVTYRIDMTKTGGP